MALVEALLGTAFVVCQVYISAVTARIWSINERAVKNGCKLGIGHKKVQLLDYPPILKSTSPHTAVRVIHEGANYFKHSAEWGHDWSKLKNNQKTTAEVIQKAGATCRSNDNFRRISKRLGNPNYCNTGGLASYLAKWQANLQKKIEKQLRQAKLL